MKTVTFTASALRQWTKLPAPIRKRIDGKIAAYLATGAGDLKRLAGRAGTRLRVGDYRVVFIEESSSLVIVAVGDRKEIYD